MALVQPKFEFHTWGGARKDAGRKPKGEKAGVSHSARPELDGKKPLHVTVRMIRGVWNLRTQRCVAPIVAAMNACAKTDEFHVVHVSVQSNHIHFIVEAASNEALTLGMRRLTIRIALGINRVMGRGKGKVFADRYHMRVLETPTEVGNALKYVLGNYQIHRARLADPIRGEFRDPYSTSIDRPFTRPTTWLLTTGWRRSRQI
jgi:hypothetical protein